MAIGTGAAVALGKAVTAGSDLNEQISKSRQVFGESSAGVEAAAQRMADSFGIPKTEFIESASSIGLIAEGAGLSADAAAKLGVSFGKLGADASSFFNVPLEEALGAIRSGLVGESEPLRRFGVLLNEEAVKAEAARLGIAAMGAELTEGQKVQARSSLITKGLAKASGDLERTSSGAANQLRSIGGRLTNVFADAGIAIQPVTETVLGLANRGFTVLAGVVERNRDTFVAWAQVAAGGINRVIARVTEIAGTIASWVSSGVGAIQGPIVALAGSLWTTIQGVAVGIKDAFFNTVLPGFVAIGERLAAFPANFTTALGPGTVGMIVGFGTTIKNSVVTAFSFIGSYVTSIVEGIGLVWRNLPDFVDIAVLQITQGILNLGAYIATIPANLGLIAEYISTNWVQLITDGVNAVGSLFENLGKNIGEFAYAIVQYLQHPFEGFQFDFTPLLEGFQATAAQLPALVGPELVSLQDQIDSKIAGIAEKEAMRGDMIAAAATKANLAAAAEVTTSDVSAPTAKVEDAAAAAAPAAVTKAPAKVAAEALTLGSTAARSADLAFRMGTGGGLEKMTADSLNVQKQQLAELKKSNAKTSGNGDLQVVEFA